MKINFSFNHNIFYVLKIVISTVFIPFIMICFLLQFDWIEHEGKIFANFSFIHKWDWVALLFSFSSLYIAILTYLSQKQTENNTVKNITPIIQKRLLERLISRLYINYIVSISIEVKCSKVNFNSYPSEEHLYKMQIPIDLIHPELFYNNPSHFDIIYEIKQMIEIYNKEIKLVWDHLMSSKITLESKEKDIENILIQKPGTLAWRLYSYIRELWPESSIDVAGAISGLHEENNATLSDITIPDDFLINSKFIKFFPDEINRERFIRKVTSDVLTAIENPNTIILLPNQ